MSIIIIIIIINYYNLSAMLFKARIQTEQEPDIYRCEGMHETCESAFLKFYETVKWMFVVK